MLPYPLTSSGPFAKVDFLGGSCRLYPCGAGGTGGGGTGSLIVGGGGGGATTAWVVPFEEANEEAVDRSI